MLLLHSDSCAGQNKNKSVLAMEKFLVDSTAIEKVTHTFMVPGRTHIECDAVQAMIEKAKNVALCMFQMVGTTLSRWPKQTNRTFLLGNSKPVWFSFGKRLPHDCLNSQQNLVL